MKKEKIGRNSLCKCGSGKKYKKCCLENKNKIGELMRSYDEYDAKSLKETINELEKREYGETRFNASLQKAQLYQKQGEHNEAISTLKNMEIKDIQEKLIIEKIISVSYLAIGKVKEAINSNLIILNNISSVEWDDEILAGFYLEAGKAYRYAGDTEKALKYWEKAATIFKDVNEMHYARAVSNIGSTMLLDDNIKEQERGKILIEQSNDIKVRLGDLSGLSTNFCNLGYYYLLKKNYQRALVNFRKDMMISKRIPDKVNLVNTYKNMAGVYIELLQLTEARINLAEAKKISDELNNEELIKIVGQSLALCNEIGKACGKKKIKIGKKAQCVCQSGETYEDCCGEADHEPVGLPWDFSKILETSSNLKSKDKDYIDSNDESTKLDFILRNTDEAKGRISWNETQFMNGWVKYSELPDMANHHLGCAEILADEAVEDEGMEKSMAAVILSVCAVEAFINQVAFFLCEADEDKENWKRKMPEELKEGAVYFQRNTELMKKWNLLGKMLCGKFWNEKVEIVNDFKDLIFVRNELIHFKSVEFEQLIPPPKVLPNVIKKLQNKIKFREDKVIPLAWPRKILTSSLAGWSVKTADKLIDYFKESYEKNRNIEKCTLKFDSSEF